MIAGLKDILRKPPVPQYQLKADALRLKILGLVSGLGRYFQGFSMG